MIRTGQFTQRILGLPHREASGETPQLADPGRSPDSVTIDFSKRQVSSHGLPEWTRRVAGALALTLCLTACTPAGTPHAVHAPTAQKAVAAQVVETPQPESLHTTQVVDGTSGGWESAQEEQLAQEIRMLREELAELKEDRAQDADLRARQERQLTREEMEAAAEVGALVLEGAVCLLLGAVSDSPC